MAESGDDLQCALNEISIYCTKWKLNINVVTTKILIFSKGSLAKRQFYYKESIIENFKEFKYLGIVFSRSGSFCKAKKHLCEQAQETMVLLEKLDSSIFQLAANSICSTKLCYQY